MKRSALFLAFALWSLRLFSQVDFTKPIGVQDAFLNQISTEKRLSPKMLDIPEAKWKKHQQQFEGTPIISYPVAWRSNNEDFGNWYTLSSGTRFWRGQISLPNANGVAIFLENIDIPKGGQFFFYNPTRPDDYRRLPNSNIPETGRLWSGIVPGSELVVEYVGPKESLSPEAFDIFRIDFVYGEVQRLNNFGESLTCNDNVNCPTGSGWQDEKKGICRIDMVLEEGLGFCTGNLMNNTAEDHKPYILTGFHCQDGFTPLYDLWLFDFFYEAPGCVTPEQVPAFISLGSCVQRAGRQESDMLLLEITGAFPESLDAYFLGWNRQEAPPTSALNIHHPSGDLKKINLFDLPIIIQPTNITWDNEVITPLNHHFRVNYTSGAFQLGSSGSALLNEDGNVVGQLHGGNSSCESTIGFYGRLSLAWEGGGTANTRLKDWLDPLNTGTMELAGKARVAGDLARVSGLIQTSTGFPVPGVTVQLIGNVVGTVQTDNNGQFVFEGLPMNTDYTIVIDKQTAAKEGLSVLDVIQIRKHLQNIELMDDPYQILAADVNNSASLTVLDVIQIQKIILNINESFSASNSWRFVPSAFQFSNAMDPFDDDLPGTFVIEGLSGDLNNINFVALKMGDTNRSYQPK